MAGSHGTRRKSRSVLTKGSVTKGLSYLLTNYKVGDRVVVNIDPSEHSTTPHRRFQGRVGVIQEVGRRTLKVAIKIGEKQKLLQTRLNHIRPLSEGKST
jgi:large subunit ribosomal protein L21e